jgi:hypothetical protein
MCNASTEDVGDCSYIAAVDALFMSHPQLLDGILHKIFNEVTVMQLLWTAKYNTILFVGFLCFHAPKSHAGCHRPCDAILPSVHRM